MMSEASNVGDEPITVPKWKLVCLLKALLKTEDPDASSQKFRKHKRPGAAAEKSSRKATGSFQKPHALGWENDPFHAMSYMARVLNMSTQLAITHRWDGNAKLFSALARQISHCPVVIWKVGAQCLSNHQDGRVDLLRSFAKTMVQVGKMAAPEILFDHTTHLISIGEYQEAKQFLENYKGKCGHKVADDVRVLLQGFRGMLEYIEWFQKKNAKDNDDIPGNQLAAIGTETEIAVHADRAVVHFNNFAGCQENCDGFISILIEILEYYNRVDELEKVLQSYLQFNEIHPSPCIFMYEFLMRHYPTDVGRQIYILEELARICPSHPYILTLCKLISEQEFVKSVQHLACLVDYEEWRNDLQVWKQMALTLITSAINCRDKSQYHTLHTLWTDRSLWWPAYHFRLEDINVHDLASAELVMYKSIVIATMFNSEHAYIMMVKEMLEVGKWENELTFLIMKLEIADHLNQQVKSKLAEKCRNPALMQIPLQQVAGPTQNKTYSMPKQAKVHSAHSNWKIAKKSKKHAKRSTQYRDKVHKLVIKKRKKKDYQNLTRRGRPPFGSTVTNGISSSSSSSSTSSSSEDSSSSSSSDEDVLPVPPVNKNLAGITLQPSVQKIPKNKIQSTANGTVSKNPTVRRTKGMPPGVSKPFVSSSDSDSDSDELPLFKQKQCIQLSATTVNAPARTTVPLKCKNAASGKAAMPPSFSKPITSSSSSNTSDSLQGNETQLNQKSAPTRTTLKCKSYVVKSRAAMPQGVSRPFISSRGSNSSDLSHGNNRQLNQKSETASTAVPLKHSNASPGVSKPFISSNNSESSDSPHSNELQLNQKSASARTAVRLKRKNNATSDKGSPPANKKSNPTQTLSNQVENASTTRTWSQSKNSSDNPGLANVQATLRAQVSLGTQSQAARNNQSLTSSSSNGVNSDTHITRKGYVRSKRKDYAPKSTTMVSNELPTQTPKDLPKNVSDQDDEVIKEEIVSDSATDCETEENLRQTGHILEWKGKSLILSSPVKLKDVAIVLKRIKTANL